jgi:hypothetical protein
VPSVSEVSLTNQDEDEDWNKFMYPSPAALLLLANIQIIRRDYSEGIEFLEQGLEISKNNVDLLRWLGHVKFLAVFNLHSFFFFYSSNYIYIYI